MHGQPCKAFLAALHRVGMHVIGVGEPRSNRIDSSQLVIRRAIMLRRSLAAILALLVVTASEAQSEGSDEAAIRLLQSKQAAAWNAHDATAYAALFTSNGDVVNVLGWWWMGRNEIQRKLTDAFAFVFRNSQLTITNVEVHKLAANIAVAHVRWTMKGALAPSGGSAPPERGIQLQVLVRGEDGWRISSFQNTNSIPERPFPQPRSATH